jgi:protocatechuate 3,4-dioxygenase beta subunit
MQLILSVLFVFLCPLMGQGQDGKKARGTILGEVVDANGERVAGAEVWLTQGVSTDRLAESKTSTGGMFSLRGVPLTATRLRVWATAQGKVAAADRVSISTSRRRDSAFLRLWDAGEITGRVVGEKGEPVEGAQVCAAFNAARGYGFEPQGEAVTAKDGRFVLPKIPLGYITIRATAMGRVLTTTRVHLRERAEIQLVMKEGPGTSLEVKVLDVDGKSLPETSVRVLPYARGGYQVLPTRLIRGRTDARGVWKVQGLPDIEFVVSVGHKGMSFSPRTIRLRAGKGPRQAQFKGFLDQAVTLRGTVMGPDGKPLTGETLLCRAANGGRRSTAVIDEKGQFQMQSPLSPGTRCVFYLTGSRFVLKHGEVPPREEGRVAMDKMRLTIERLIQSDKHYAFQAMLGMEVSGRLVAGDGQPVALQRVSLAHDRSNWSPSWRSFAYATTDRRGNFVVRGVRPTEAAVRIESKGRGGAITSEPFQLDPGKGKAGLRLVCSMPAKVKGILLDAEGKPVPGARIWLRDCHPETGAQTNGSVKEVYTDRKGRFCHLAVAPGGHRLRAFLLGKRELAVLQKGSEPFLVESGNSLQIDLQIQ